MASSDYRHATLTLVCPISDDQEKALWALLPRTWTEVQKSRFMARVIEALSLHRQKTDRPELAPAKLKGHYESVVTSGRKTLAALDQVPASAWARSDMRAATAAPAASDGRIDLTSTIAARARLALVQLVQALCIDASAVPIGKHVRPSRTAARQLCIAIAEAHQDIAGKAPLLEDFVYFMGEVGKCGGLKIGRPVVTSALKVLAG